MNYFLLLKSRDIALALTLGVTLVTISPSWAGGCTVADLKGGWGYSEQGFSVLADGSQTPISEAGIIKANGQGKLSSSASAIWLLVPAEQPLSITFSTTGPGEGYTVNSDCTGDATFSVTVTDKNGAPVRVNPIDGSNILPGRTIHFVLDTNKTELKFVSTSPGTSATGTANKQNLSNIQ